MRASGVGRCRRLKLVYIRLKNTGLSVSIIESVRISAYCQSSSNPMTRARQIFRQAYQKNNNNNQVGVRAFLILDFFLVQSHSSSYADSRNWTKVTSSFLEKKDGRKQRKTKRKNGQI